jgi:hypothetical protein
MANVKNTDKYSFYDVKSKSKFVPKEYDVKIRNKRRFAVAKNPKTGVECWRVLGMVKK